MIWYRYILKLSRRQKIEPLQSPNNNCFAINRGVLLNVDFPSCFSAKKNLHTTTSNSIIAPSRGSRMVIEPSPTFVLDSKTTFFEKSTTSSGDTPSYVSKFINYLMTSGKKGVAIALFVTCLRLFLKELQEDKRIDALGRGSIRFEDSASPVSSKELALESLVSTKSLFLLRKPGKNLLGLDFFPVSPVVDNYKVPFLLESRKNKILQAIPPLARKKGVTEKLEVREADRSVMSSRFVLYCQGPFSTKNRFITNDETNNAISLQSFVNQRVMFVGLGSHGESKKEQFSRFLPLLSCLESALKNVEPNLEIRKKKIAGITRQIPCIVSKSRGQGLAIRWVIDAAQEKRRRESKSFSKSLAEELVNAYHKRGEPRQKRESLHKLAESNRSFLRYRWW